MLESPFDVTDAGIIPTFILLTEESQSTKGEKDEPVAGTRSCYRSVQKGC